ncbi:MAG: hypothetical protein CUN56_05530 [Phototrophicales bacterium]|nr:MAG: hypothetical protein CUN56_05530 [Phototrophicales bacterium]
MMRFHKVTIWMLLLRVIDVWIGKESAVTKWIIGISLVLVLSGCAGTPENPDSTGQTTQATSTPVPIPPVAERPSVTVQRGDVVDEIIFTGQWLPRDQQELSFEIAGSLRSVLVQRGDSVSAGQLLADYQITELEDQLVTAQIDLETAQLRLETGTEGSADAVLNAQFALADANISLESTTNNAPWTNLESARIGLEDAQRRLDNAQRAYDNAIADPSTPASQVDSAYQSLQDARSALRSAQNQYYAAAQSFNQHQYSLQRAENAVLQREIDLEQAQAGAGVDPEQVQAVRQAQIRVDQILADIARSSLYAPFDGVVLEVNYRPGDQVGAFNTVMTLAIPEPKEVVANLSFNDIQTLDVGMLGVCQLVNRAETAVQCVVRAKPFTSTDADQTVRVAADLQGDLQLGQLVEVIMPLETRQNVLWLPPRAIRTLQNRTFVVVRTPDGDRVVDIELGLQTADRVEIITDQLQEGDVIVVP